MFEVIGANRLPESLDLRVRNGVICLSHCAAPPVRGLWLGRAAYSSTSLVCVYRATIWTCRQEAKMRLMPDLIGLYVFTRTEYAVRLVVARSS
jgi:hypothetical protein